MCFQEEHPVLLQIPTTDLLIVLGIIDSSRITGILQVGNRRMENDLGNFCMRQG